MLFHFAWRNIWRNKRRTLITMSSIAFAVFFACMMQAIQEGSWDNMINNVINSYTGNIQLHKKGYWENPSINDLMPYDDSLKNIKEVSDVIVNAVPRLESFALVSTGNNTKGTLVVGIKPDVEDLMTHMADRVTEGEYLTSNDPGVLLADGLAKSINAVIGDTVFLISQGYRGVNAVGQYPVRGFVHFPYPQMNKGTIIMPLNDAQRLYGAEGLINTLVLQTDENSNDKKLTGILSATFDTSAIEIMTFGELMPELLRSKEIDGAGNYIIFFVLYMIIGFGIFGTLLMMLRERQYEMGVLLSIGMQRFQIFGMIWLELLLLGALGAVVGIILGYAGAWYIHLNPIPLTGDMAAAMEKFEFEPFMPASVNAHIFLQQGFFVFMICMALSLVPLYHILKIRPVEAMKA